MALMDFTASGDDAEPTFLYALPLGPTRLFVEETSLVARRPPSLDRLRRSLETRLRRMRIEPLSVRHIERCVIPMGLALPLPRQRIVAFGAAASMVHPATGYQLMRALRTAGTVADAIARSLGGSATRSPVGPDAAARAAYHALWPRRDRTAWRLYRFGMDVLTRLSRDELAAFMRAFFNLPAATWQRYLTGALGPLDIALAMLRMLVVADADTRRQLLACLPLATRTPLLPQASLPEAAPRSP
jgi:lycopene beta-cyclase